MTVLCRQLYLKLLNDRIYSKENFNPRFFKNAFHFESMFPTKIDKSTHAYNLCFILSLVFHYLIIVPTALVYVQQIVNSCSYLKLPFDQFLNHNVFSSLKTELFLLQMPKTITDRNTIYFTKLYTQASTSWCIIMRGIH